ncbi:MAG TPA: cytochrome b [Casimicrobiaceae bacterium]
MSTHANAHANTLQHEVASGARAASSDRYDTATIVLHWAIAILVVTLLATGWYMVGVPKLTPARGFWYNLHKSLGIVTAALIVILSVRRMFRRAPPLPATMPGWEQRAAHLNHLAFYALLVLSTAAGYLTSSFSRFGPKVFGIPLPHWGWDDVAQRTQYANAHRVITWVFAALIVVHVAAALKHLVVDRDGVVARMLPGR